MVKHILLDSSNTTSYSIFYRSKLVKFNHSPDTVYCHANAWSHLILVLYMPNSHICKGRQSPWPTPMNTHRHSYPQSPCILIELKKSFSCGEFHIVIMNSLFGSNQRVEAVVLISLPLWWLFLAQSACDPSGGF